jgi:small multidrug resistance pump
LIGAASLATYAVSLTILSFSLKVIPVGVAYAIWSGVGTATIVLMGVVIFKEPITAVKVVCIAMIVVGAVGLNLASKS